MTTYREPGTYLQVQNNPAGAITSDTAMIPLIMGSGATKLTKTFSMVRGSGSTDTFSVTSVISMSHIGYSRVGVSDWTETTDYTLSGPGMATPSGETSQIAWVDDHGPSEGSTYFVTVVYDVEDPDQYEPQLFTNVQQVIDFYGPDIQENEEGTPVCPVSLGAQLALLQGAPSVHVLQVKIAGMAIAGTDYQTALDTYARYISTAWRIVPMDVGADIQTVVAAHVNIMSSYEERLERSAFFGYTSTMPTTFTGVGGVLDVIGTYASSLDNQRISTIYPCQATRELSNGTLTTLSSPYILAALAGLASLYPPQRSYTRLSLGVFTSLLGVKMTRTQMNQLAALGVMVLTQAGDDLPIVVRHGLTTDMTSTQTRENSLLAIQDYCSKYLRNLCEQYIGKYNITPELITMIRGTVASGLNDLSNKGVIIQGSGIINSVAQDAENLDTIIINLTVGASYPLNYIEITLVLD